MMEFLVGLVIGYAVVTIVLLPFQGTKAFAWPLEVCVGVFLIISSMDN